MLQKGNTRVGRRIIPLFALLLVAAQPSPVVRLQIPAGPDAACMAEWNGEALDLDQLSARTRAWPGDRAHVHIDGSVEVPYKCVGAVIYKLQAAGFSNIGFPAEPSPDRIIVTADRRCTPSVNGRAVTLPVLRSRARSWQHTRPDLHFKPGKSVTYRCATRILDIFREAGIGKTAIVGSESLDMSERSK